MCRDVQAWSHVVDEHNFVWREPATDARTGGARLQVLQCPHGDVLLVAVQGWGCGDGVSVVNAAEVVAVQVVTEMRPEWQRAPDLYVALLEDGGSPPWTTLAIFAVDVRVVADFVQPRPWDAIVTAHAELSRGGDHVPVLARLSPAQWLVTGVAASRYRRRPHGSPLP